MFLYLPISSIKELDAVTTLCAQDAQGTWTFSTGITGVHSSPPKSGSGTIYGHHGHGPHGSRQRSHAHTLHGHTRRSACLLCSPTEEINAEKKMLVITWGRCGQALSRDRNIAHSFPCQKGHHRTKSRAGPPTILDSRFLRWKASTYQRKGEEACSRSKTHKEIKLLQPNEQSTSCSLRHSKC